MEGETVLLWRADSRVAGGWKEGHSYRFSLIHRPRLGLIKLRLWEGEMLIADSGNVIDDGQHSLRGGRLGVYCDSQEGIIWSALSYSCSNELPTDMDSSIPEIVTNKKK